MFTTSNVVRILTHSKKLRYDLDFVCQDDKYEINLLRARINVANDRIGKQKRVGRLRR